MDEIPLPVDNATAAAVGRIAMRHGQLDYLLRMTVRQMAGLTRIEALNATDDLGFEKLRLHVKDVAKKAMKDHLKPLHLLYALLARARKANRRRNEILHGVWGWDADGNPTLQDDEHRAGPPPTAKELQQIADDLAQIAAELNHARREGYLAEVFGYPMGSPAS